MHQRDDCAVIAASRDRPELFEIVFDRHYDAVVRFATGRVGPNEADDIASETFVRAFARRHRFRSDRTSALPWLFGIAANVARERLRSRSRRSRAIERSAALLIPDESRFDAEADARVDATTWLPSMLAALSALSDDEYRVLMLAAVGELSYQEIADHLDIPIGTVRSRLSRARRRVRELLAAVRPILAGSEDPVHGPLQRLS